MSVFINFFNMLQEQVFCYVPLKEAKRPNDSDMIVSNLSLLCLQSSSIS